MTDERTHVPALRGVAYDTGTNFATGQGDLSRTVWSTAVMESEVSLVADQLNANSITVYGSDLGRLEATARAALDRGLHVTLQPRLVDRPATEVLAHLGEAAVLAESLRRDGADLTLTVGAVHLLFTPGIIDGGQYHERMANLYADAEHHLLHPTGPVDLIAATPRLHAFLEQAAAMARASFRGTLGYSAAHFEDVDWRHFDVIGLMHQYQPRRLTHAEHRAEIARYRSFGKPVVVAEYGTATYRGAADRAFFFWDVVDRDGSVPTVLPGVVRDEGAQAEYHLEMQELFAGAGVAGVIVSELIHPTHPHHPSDPSLDIDVASMALVKTIREDFADPASSYQWEPKESFHALADHFAHVGFQAGVR